MTLTIPLHTKDPKVLHRPASKPNKLQTQKAAAEVAVAAATLSNSGGAQHFPLVCPRPIKDANIPPVSPFSPSLPPAEPSLLPNTAARGTFKAFFFFFVRIMGWMRGAEG